MSLARTRSAVVAAITLGAALSGPAALAANKEKASVPWTVALEVHWGAKKNRETYRSGFERILLATLLEKACFQSVVGPDRADVVLDVQLDDFVTQQEYHTAENVLPGQGEQHELRSARATVKLDYSLRTHPPDDREILGGKCSRVSVRQPQTPADPAEQRALNDLTADVARWIVHEICDHRGRLAEKIAKALAASKPSPAP